MCENKIPIIKLADQNKIPQLGLGTYLMQGKECIQAVSEALKMGYRHLDTATVYENEDAVGTAIKNSKIPRENIFLTTKLANSDQKQAHNAFQKSLNQLQTEYVDLYLLHWPLPKRNTAVAAWQAIIEIAEKGYAKSIGVCNFEIEHLEKLYAETGVYPSVNQIELHPEHQRRELVDYCHTKGIAVQAWGPLAQMKSDLLQKETILNTAKKHAKTPAQIVLRWHIEKEHIVIPKSANKTRLKENYEIFDFTLTSNEIAEIDALETATNYGPNPRDYDG